MSSNTLQGATRTNHSFFTFVQPIPHRGGGERADLPYKPNAFGNQPAGYPGVQSVYYNPEEVEVP